MQQLGRKSLWRNYTPPPTHTPVYGRGRKHIWVTYFLKFSSILKEKKHLLVSCWINWLWWQTVNKWLEKYCCRDSSCNRLQICVNFLRETRARVNNYLTVKVSCKICFKLNVLRFTLCEGYPFALLGLLRPKRKTSTIQRYDHLLLWNHAPGNAYKSINCSMISLLHM